MTETSRSTTSISRRRASAIRVARRRAAWYGKELLTTIAQALPRAVAVERCGRARRWLGKFAFTRMFDPDARVGAIPAEAVVRPLSAIQVVVTAVVKEGVLPRIVSLRRVPTIVGVSVLHSVAERRVSSADAAQTAEIVAASNTLMFANTMTPVRSADRCMCLPRFQTFGHRWASSLSAPNARAHRQGLSVGEQTTDRPRINAGRPASGREVRREPSSPRRRA